MSAPRHEPVDAPPPHTGACGWAAQVRPLLALIAALSCAAASGSCGGDEASTPLPALVRADPPDLTSHVVVTTWIDLVFADVVPEDAAASFTLRCDDDAIEFDVDHVADTEVVINPRTPLPNDSVCTVAWTGPNDEPQAIHVQTAAAQPPAFVPYDRRDTATLVPLPDDYWRADAGSGSAAPHLVIPPPTTNDAGRSILTPIIAAAASDGYSPLTPIVVALPAAADAQSLPHTAADSLAPLASVGLFEVGGGDATPGRRVPVFTSLRRDVDRDESVANHLLLFPAEPLRPEHTYVAVVTRRVLVGSRNPLDASPFMREALGVDPPRDDAAARAHDALTAARAALEAATPPLRSDDVALALSFTVRSTAAFPRDRRAIAALVAARPPPTFTIDSVTPAAEPALAAIVSGTWQAPAWSDGMFFHRDEAGLPVPRGTHAVPFTLALPASATTTAVPVVMYQHGTPGDAAREVPWAARTLSGGATEFATIGFTDALNRDTDGLMLGPDVFAAMTARGEFPDILYDMTFAEQLSFLALIRSLGDLDVLPIDAPDGTPELDVTAPLSYLGVSHGSINGVGLLPYAPAIHAAVLAAGGGNYAGILAHQASYVVDMLAQDDPGVRYTDVYAALPLLQIAIDAQDPLNHAHLLYREPLDRARSQHASVLMTEGLSDSYVPLWSTQTAAAALGIPQVAPIALPASSGVVLDPPVTANIDARTTAALAQYVPAGVPGAPATPSCQASDQREGHFCQQTSDEAVLQRRAFLISATSGAPPTIESFVSSAATSATAPGADDDAVQVTTLAAPRPGPPPHAPRR